MRQMLGMMAAATLVGAAGGARLERERYDLGPDPTAPSWDRGTNWKFRDTKPAGPTDEQRKAKRKAQRSARRKNRK